MQVITPYFIQEFSNFYKFSIDGKEFVTVDLLTLSPEGSVKEFNFKIFTLEQWREIMKHGVLPVKETIGENIMVGDYYQ